MNRPLRSVFGVDKPSFEAAGCVNHFWCIQYDNTGRGNHNKNKQTKTTTATKTATTTETKQTNKNKKQKKTTTKATRLVGSCINKEKGEVNW